MEEEGNPNTGGQQNILDDPSLMDEQQLINWKNDSSNSARLSLSCKS
jgi:hypothetical protein